ncbi:unnamed protein product, partial [Ilex paraguariensis]
MPIHFSLSPISLSRLSLFSLRTKERTPPELLRSSSLNLDPISDFFSQRIRLPRRKKNCLEKRRESA